MGLCNMKMQNKQNGVYCFSLFLVKRVNISFNLLSVFFIISFFSPLQSFKGFYRLKIRRAIFFMLVYCFLRKWIRGSDTNKNEKKNGKATPLFKPRARVKLM